MPYSASLRWRQRHFAPDAANGARQHSKFFCPDTYSSHFYQEYLQRFDYVPALDEDEVRHWLLPIHDVIYSYVVVRKLNLRNTAASDRPDCAICGILLSPSHHLAGKRHRAAYGLFQLLLPPLDCDQPSHPQDTEGWRPQSSQCMRTFYRPRSQIHDHFPLCIAGCVLLLLRPRVASVPHADEGGARMRVQCWV